MIMDSVLVIQDVPIECINAAAVTYHVPAKMILSVLNTEGGKAGMAKTNRNGSVDLGPMQINSVWLPTLARYGLKQEDIQFDPCINVKVGTWILSQGIVQGKDYWKGIGNYHSHNNQFNMSYQIKVRKRYEKLSILLSDEKGNVHG